MFFGNYLHEVIITNKRTIIILDVSDTPDCGWEGAYSIIEENAFAEAWKNCPDVNGEYTDDDIKEWAEELCGQWPAIWEIVSNHHRSPETAEKKLKAFIKKNFN